MPPRLKYYVKVHLKYRFTAIVFLAVLKPAIFCRTRRALQYFAYSEWLRQLKFTAAYSYGVQECDARMLNAYCVSMVNKITEVLLQVFALMQGRAMIVQLFFLTDR